MDVGGLLAEADSDGTPVLYPFEIVRPNKRKEETQGAPGDIYQKTVAIESSHSDQGVGNGRVHDRLDRQAW